MKKAIIIITILLLFCSLLLIFGSDEQNLGDNYYYLPEYEAVDVGYPEGATIYKSSQKYAYEEIKVCGDIVCVKKNKRYIIVAERVDSTADIVCKHLSNADSVSLHYFIIAKSSGIVFGPYRKLEYLQKREELGISKKLEF